jgi:aminocarboxymuconate-semialdehyde decarboxylase
VYPTMAAVASTIDIHTHIMPPGWDELKLAEVGGGWPHALLHDACSATIMTGEKRFRDVDDRSFVPARRIADMDAHGIDKQLLSPIPVMFCYWGEPDRAAELARVHNSFIGETVAATPKRFVGAGTVPMQSAPHAIREIERLARDGFRAIEIGTNINNRDLDDPAVIDILEAAAGRGLAVFVHPATPAMGEERMRAYYLPFMVAYPAETSLAIARLIFGGILDKIPALRIAFAHGGGAFPSILGRLDHGFRVRPEARVAIERPPSEYAHRLFFDCLTHDVRALAGMIERFGSDRIMVGSDYPFDMGVDNPIAQLEGLTLSNSERNDLDHRTAEAFLDL